MLLRLAWAGILSVSILSAQRGDAGGLPQGGAARGGALGLGEVPVQQQALDPKQLCTLEGRVVHAQTGAPVPRATVTLSGGGAGGRGAGGGPSGVRIARTDSDGRFVLERVPPGTYRLVAERVGFLRQPYGAQSPGGAGAPINLSPGQTVKNLDIRMTPQGVILGLVLDEDGDPVPRATVTAFRAGQRMALGSGRGGAAGESAASATTNDIGEFRLAGLPPGEYLVVASAQFARGGRGGFDPALGGPGRGMASALAMEEDILPTYYPSTTDANSAVPVAAIPGQETRGITIMLRSGNLFRVQGRVAGVAPDQAAMVRVMLTPRGDTGRYLLGAARSGQVRADGTFELPRVAPGSYYLIAQTVGRGGGGRGGALGAEGGAVGRTTVDVSTGDVRDVVVTLTDPLTVTGTVRVEGQQTAASQTLTLTLVPVERIPGLPVGTAVARVAQGAFKMTGVTPDVYYVNASGLPDGAYLKSVRLNQQETLEKGIDLTAARGAVTLDVTVALKGAAIEGTVTSGGDPAPGSWILLLADPLRPAQPYLNRSATSDQDGKFAIRGLAPGSYKLYAFVEAQPDIMADLDRVKAFDRHAVSVRLSEGETETVGLRVLNPDEIAR